jgi:hypothetical protein
MKNLTKTIASLILLVGFSNSIFAADMQTVTLNTGYNHAINARYTRPNPFNYPLGNTVNHKDEYWTLISDPNTNGGTPIPRQSDIMPNHPAWAPALANSEWIAFQRNGSPRGTAAGAYTYIFEKCFCLKKGFDSDRDAVEKTKLEIEFRADDWGAVYINQTVPEILQFPGTIPGPPYNSTNPLANGSVNEPYALVKGSTAGGGFVGPTGKVTMAANELIKRLKVGRNCIQVKIYDLGRLVSGFNLAGSITAAGIDEVAKFNPKNPKQQFSQCSACAERRRGDGATDAVENPRLEVKDIKVEAVRP